MPVSVLEVNEKIVFEFEGIHPIDEDLSWFGLKLKLRICLPSHLYKLLKRYNPPR